MTGVGVLVPVGGFAPFLAEALDAVLAQRPDAVVVVDDAADPAVVLHPDHAPHVTLVRRDARGGPAGARATGLEHLPEDCDLVALCDADDVWEPGKLAAQRRALDDPAVGLVFGRATVVGVDGRPTGETWATPPAGPLDPVALFAANPVPTSSVVLRRRALRDAGGFLAPVPVAEDWDLWLRVARTGHRLVAVPEARVRYRRHPGGLTADVAGLARSQLRVHRAHADLVAPAQRDRVLAADLRALARGLARAGDARGARAALAEAAQVAAPSPRDRALAAALALPGVRGLAGRADPYRG
ncbi:glycosyltransferase [Conexibacter sp. SYSU D00693]|uniref:glycosyltransferase n=1 Tax=Conexibacter sp. SYSU D00693 TaxID=2812560 RepID=UPI00196A6401|nr:glycosyltransferase [Conexibacter sp. SYSU D00693]